MNITKKTEGNTTTFVLSGRLDTITSPQLEKELKVFFDETPGNLVFDFKDLEYISSSGLRIVLWSQKEINKLEKTMKVSGVNETVREVFEITGFTGIVNIE